MKWLLVLLAACVSLPRVPAEPRNHAERERAAVRVVVACSVYGMPGWDDEPHLDEGTILHTGSGVVIDERHALTAAHLTRCPTIPGVVLTTYDGRHLVAVVTHEDLDRDVAVLELATADRMHLDVAPPVLATAAVGDVICIEAAAPKRRETCGAVVGIGKTIHVAVAPSPGASGAGAYNELGALVGTRVGHTLDDVWAGVVPLRGLP